MILTFHAAMLKSKRASTPMLRSHSYYRDVMKRLSNNMAEHGMSSFTVCFIAVERRNHLDLDEDLGAHNIMILVQLYERR